jgi:hypothetical protein
MISSGNADASRQQRESLRTASTTSIRAPSMLDEIIEEDTCAEIEKEDMDTKAFSRYRHRQCGKTL